MIRPRRGRWCRSATALLILSAWATGCTTADGADPPLSPSPVPTVEARNRLFALGDAWSRTVATVTYRTTGHVPGQPETAHLCLRQMSEGRVRLIDRDQDFGEERKDLLRRCSRQGILRLLWDPPDGWQMDVTTPVDHFTLASSGDRTQICRSGIPHPCRMIPADDAIRRARADVFFRSPARILGEIGATDVRRVESNDDAIVPVECFAASGSDEHVEWCYASDGTLVSFLRGSGGTGWESFEARDVS